MFVIGSRWGAGLAALAVLSWSAPSAADSLVRAQIALDVSNAKAPVVQQTLQWAAEGGKPRSQLAFHLARGVEVTAARSEGKDLTFRGEEVRGAPHKRWVLTLPVPLNAGATRAIEITTRITTGSVPGIRAAEDGGYLLPGSGWFPAIEPETDELPPHTVEFRGPAEWTGIASGTQAAGGAKWTSESARPYAAWGPYSSSPAEVQGVAFTLWRRDGKGEPARLANVAKIIQALGTGVGEAPGSGPWKLIDVGRGISAGGHRTLFWDESSAAAKGTTTPDLVDQELASGLAEAHWQEAMRFRGDLAAFTAGGISRALGDAAALTLDASDQRWRSEARLLGARRSAFQAGRSGDRPLQRLLPRSAEAIAVLDGRGALVAHMAAEACPSPTHWIHSLQEIRATTMQSGKPLTGEGLFDALDAKYTNQHKFLKAYLETTDLPDFVLVSHGPAKQGAQGDRYRVEVRNDGDAAGWVEVATYTSKDQLLRSTRLFLETGETRAVLLGDARRIGRIRLDPRGTTPQIEVANENVVLAPMKEDDNTPYVPAFRFSAADGRLHEVASLDLTLDGVTVRGFQGAIQWFETYHGPSGAVLLGAATVEVHPTGEFAEAFRKAMGKDTVTFDAKNLFIRFPVSAWSKIEPAIGEPVTPERGRELAHMRQFVYEHSFPTYFHEKSLAQVPPPGGAMVVCGLGGEEWRGFVREPLPDGRVRMRLWDQLRGTVIWEAVL